jgi:hypothetical protein
MSDDTANADAPRSSTRRPVAHARDRCRGRATANALAPPGRRAVPPGCSTKEMDLRRALVLNGGIASGVE